MRRNDAAGASWVPTAGELADLDAAVNRALDTGDRSGLNVVGFGEVSMALGWPVAEPTAVCKRMPPLDAASFERHADLVDRYVTELRSRGVSVVDTHAKSLDVGDRVVGYLVQPMLDPESIGAAVLRRGEPDSEHPLLAAIADVIGVVDDRVSADAQVTNFSFVDGTATLLDVGTPFMWDADGRLELEIRQFSQFVPALLRPVVVSELTKVVNRWSDPRAVAIDVAANLYREGLVDWVEPTLSSFNRLLDLGAPIGVEDAKASYREDLKTFPLLKRLQRAERFWRTKVRRQRYEFFIESTFGDVPELD